MAKENGEIKFHNQNIFTGETGIIDSSAGIIRGASLIKAGEAEGHGLLVDDTLLKQLQACGKEKGKVSINLDHGSGITSTCGFVTGFRIDGDKLRGDIHLLQSHPETPVILERAQKMPECFGLSVAFKPDDHGAKGEPLGGGKFAARCSKLMSVDLVTRPAANAGLFSVPEVDKTKKSMAKKEVKLAEGDDPNTPNPEQGTEPTLQDVIAAIQDMSGRLDQHEQFLGQLQGSNEPSLEDLTKMNEEELAQLGLTRAEVDAAVQEVLAGMEGEGVQGQEQEQGQGQEGELEGAVAGSGSGTAAGQTSGAANLSAIQKQVIRLESKLKLKELREKQHAEEVELSAIEQKVLILAKQRDDAIELAEKLQAKNEALEVALKTGTRPVKAGIDSGMRMFSADNDGELTEFQVRVKQLTDSGKTPGEAVMLAQKENPAAHAMWVRSQSTKTA